MSHGLRLVLALTVSSCALVALGLLGSSGCVYERCECPCLDDDGGIDGGGDLDGDADGDETIECEGPVEETAPRAYIVGHAAPDNYVTLAPGGSVELAAALDPEWVPPMDCLLPVSYRWDLADGTTSDAQSPGAVSFAAPGFYTIGMTARNSQGTPDQIDDELYVSIWSGTLFTDDFEGTDPLDPDRSGWARRVSDMIREFNPYFGASPPWQVQPHAGGHRIYSGDWGQAFDYCQPGSQGLLSRLEARDARLSVLQYRQDPPVNQPHFTDIILRYRYLGLGATNAISQFYRARIAEVTTEEAQYCMCLDVFKIDGEDEGGDGLEGSTLTGCENQLCGYTADSFYVTVEITGTGPVRIAFSISQTLGGAAWNSHTFVDSSDVIAEPGRFGISQCVGETYFDDYRLERLD